MGKTGSPETDAKRAKKLENFKGKPGQRFDSNKQPSGAAKSAGWLRKKRGTELCKSILELAFKGAKNSEIKKAAAEYYNIPESEITVEMMMLFRQAEKAIQKADTHAFNAIMNRAHGLPKETIDITDKTFIVNVPDE